MEQVVIENRGGTIADLDGWTLHDAGEKHMLTFGTFPLGPGQRVTIQTGQDAQTSLTVIAWKPDNVWNNDGDTAHLVSPEDQVVSTLRC